ncbi:MAG TPA: Holliday junction resolvase RuvX [Phycisphaerales bacterium]|nr:Holliday junction resolvase RuvX [Phycisphaerales bacterium]
MRYLCIDLGDKRTGIAVGDDVTRLATPVEVLEVPRERDAGRALLDAVARAVEEQVGPRDELVVGLPLNMDGSEGERAKLVRAFAGAVRERTGRVVHLHDERLSSVQADWDMGRTGLTHKQKKARRDALAAAAILRDFLTTHPAGA